jgi:3-hydroxybutyryl-CoA dehydrogenase
MKEICNVLIYGHGVMGKNVARTFARSGFRTAIKTRHPPTGADLPNDITFIQELPRQAPDLIIEFVPENVTAKLAVFAEIDAGYPNENVIIATGTSGLDVAELARGLRRPENFLALHYFMPADRSLVVEVMAGPMTSAELVDSLAEVMRKTGKEPIKLYKPVVGFLVNRLQHAILHEAYYLIENGISNVEEIDHAAKRLLGPRMCLNGLLQQKDISGLRVHADAQRTIVPELYHNRTPNPMLQAMVSHGHTGINSGTGFYNWENCDVEAVKTQASARLQELMEMIDKHLAATSAPNTRPKTGDPRQFKASKSAC